MEKETEILTEIRPVTIPKKPKAKPNINAAKSTFKSDSCTVTIFKHIYDLKGRLQQESEPVEFILEKKSKVINISSACVAIINSESFDSYNKLEVEQKIIVLECFNLGRGECVTLEAGKYKAINKYGAYKADLFIC